jgi:hypothetical protein
MERSRVKKVNCCQSSLFISSAIKFEVSNSPLASHREFFTMSKGQIHRENSSPAQRGGSTNLPTSGASPSQCILRASASENISSKSRSGFTGIWLYRSTKRNWPAFELSSAKSSIGVSGMSARGHQRTAVCCSTIDESLNFRIPTSLRRQRRKIATVGLQIDQRGFVETIEPAHQHA